MQLPAPLLSSSSKIKKNPSRKKILVFKEMKLSSKKKLNTTFFNFLDPKNLITFFYNLKKLPYQKMDA